MDHMLDIAFFGSCLPSTLPHFFPTSFRKLGTCGHPTGHALGYGPFPAVPSPLLASFFSELFCTLPMHGQAFLKAAKGIFSSCIVRCTKCRIWSRIRQWQSLPTGRFLLLTLFTHFCVKLNIHNLMADGSERVAVPPTLAHEGSSAAGGAAAAAAIDGARPRSLSSYWLILPAMQLGLSALRLPSSLAELGSSPLFSAAGAAGAPDAAELAAVLQQARRRPVSELDWALLFQAVSSGQLQGSQAEKLVAVLTWAADSAREQLEAATAAGERPSGGGAATAAAAVAADVGNPRLRQAQQNTLKLSLLFLCSMARGEGTANGDAQHPAPGSCKRGGKKHKGPAGGGEAAAEALAQLRVRRDALLAAGSIEDALHDNRALLPVSDLRAAGRLVRGAAMHCLAHPLPPGAAGGDRTAKDLAEACFQGSAGVFNPSLSGCS